HRGTFVRPATLAHESVDRLIESLAMQPLAARCTIAGLDPRRADVIVAGAAIVRAVMRWSGSTLLHASAGGVRIGLLRKAIASDR
ncbi:MAG: Ppx/GppA phosphatase family protein, partial [Thermoanaerobaculia bacterium]